MRTINVLSFIAITTALQAWPSTPAVQRPRPKAAPKMYNVGLLNEVMSKTMGHKLLAHAEERTCTDRVAELQVWCAVRDGLAAELGRQPTQDEWARALGLRGSSAGEAVEILDAQLREKKRAKDVLVQSNLRLVMSIAKRFTGRGLPLEDLMQEGTIGLITAAEKFEPERGWRFSTYATYWVRQAVQRAVERHGTPIRLPVYLHTRIGQVRRELAKGYVTAAASGEGAAAPPPTVEACARKLQLTPLQLQRTLEAMEASRCMLSLDAKTGRAGDGDDRTMLSRVADARDSPAEYEARERAGALQALLEATLSADELRIMQAKYGVGGEPKRALRKIAEELGCSPYYVTEVKQRALRKLRRAVRSAKVAATLM